MWMNARVLVRSLLASYLAICLASAAPAEKRVALIVANGAYRGAPLQNPAIDADIVAASLKRIGFEVRVVKDVGSGDFDSIVSAFADDAEGAEVALFYFAGHGFTVNEGVRPVSLLMSTSADISAKREIELRAGGIPLNVIADMLAGRAKATLMFIDACRSDPRVARGALGTGRGFERMESLTNASLYFVLSTTIGATAEDGEAGKGSPFARAFAQDIQLRGMRIDDVYRHIRDSVKAETDGRQIPEVIKDDLPQGSITLVKAEVGVSRPADVLQPNKEPAQPAQAPRNLRACLSAGDPVSCVERGYPRQVVAACEKSAATTAPTGQKLFDMNELINCFAMSESSGGE
jgi:hypothetical protein